MQTRSRKLRTDLSVCTTDGALYSFMVGVGEMFFIPFALALGFSEVEAGLCFSIPFLLGATLQLVAPWGIDALRSPRRWVILCATVQSCSFIPLIIAAWIGSIPMPLLFATLAVYWGTALGAGPAWTAWVGALIPSDIRPRYFGIRTRVCQLATLGGLSAAGVLLWLGRSADAAKTELTTALNSSAADASQSALQGHADHAVAWELLAFAAMFILAALGRGISTRFLWLQSEPPPGNWNQTTISPLRLPLRPLAGPERNLLLFMLLFQIALQISSPFVGSYLIGHLHYSNTMYFVAVALMFGCKSIASAAFGAMAASHGARRVLVIGSVLLAIHGALLAIPAGVWTIMLLMSGAGIAWAAYELATFLLILDVSRPTDRTSLMTSYLFLNAGALLGGSLLGGWILRTMGSHEYAYTVLFLTSSIARAGMLPLLKRVPEGRLGSRSAAARSSNGAQEDGAMTWTREGGA
jgi:MFS family permease